MTLVKVNNRPANNLFDDFFNFPSVFGKHALAGSQFHQPAVNIVEKAEGYQLDVAAPGYEKTDFKVNLENDLLTISAERKEEKTNEQERAVRREFTTQSFKRSFSLDEKIDAAGITAKYENGVLKLFLPKKAETAAPQKSIEIQ